MKSEVDVARLEIWTEAKAAVAEKEGHFREIGAKYLSSYSGKNEPVRQAPKVERGSQTEVGAAPISSQVAFLVNVLNILQSGDESMLRDLQPCAEERIDALEEFDRCSEELIRSLAQQEVAAEITFLAGNLRRIITQSIRERLALSREIKERLIAALHWKFPNVRGLGALPSEHQL